MGRWITKNGVHVYMEKENNDLASAKKYLEISSNLSNDFKLPTDACQAYTRVYEVFKILKNEL